MNQINYVGKRAFVSLIIETLYGSQMTNSISEQHKIPNATTKKKKETNKFQLKLKMILCPAQAVILYSIHC